MPQPFNNPYNAENNIIFQDHSIDTDAVKFEANVFKRVGHCILICAKVNVREAIETGMASYLVTGYFNDVQIFQETIFKLGPSERIYEMDWIEQFDGLRCNRIKINLQLDYLHSSTHSLYTAEY